MPDTVNDWPVTLEEYRQAVGFFAFEAYQVRLFLQLCKRTPARGYDRSYIDDAFEYAFYVHLRVILGFFEYRKTKPGDDDITYRTFEPHWKERIYAPPSGEFPERLMKYLNKRVAHLSKSRKGDQPVDAETNNPLKYYLDFGDKICPIITEFVENLTPELQETFNKRTEAFQARDRNQPHTLQSRFRIED